MKKYFMIMLVVLSLALSSLACGEDEYNGQMGDLLGIAGTLESLTQ